MFINFNLLIVVVSFIYGLDFGLGWLLFNVFDGLYGINCEVDKLYILINELNFWLEVKWLGIIVI